MTRAKEHLYLVQPIKFIPNAAASLRKWSYVRPALAVFAGRQTAVLYPDDYADGGGCG